MQLLPRNVYRRNTFQISRNTDNIPSSKQDQRLFKMSIKAIQELTGIHWDTIRKVQREIMDEAIWEREKMLREEGYKPMILAADEFAIHKGHSYATCVMDLEQGELIK